MKVGPGNAAGLFRYLSDCYRESGSRAGITSLESSRVHGSILLKERDEIVTDTLLEGQLFVPGKKAATIATNAKLHHKDRDLFYGSVFLIGELENGGPGRKPAYAPLLLYPATVSHVMEGEGAEFLVDTSRTILNYALLEGLGDPEFVERVDNAVAETGHTEGCVSALATVLSSEFPDLDSEPLRDYPKLLTGIELKGLHGKVEVEREVMYLVSAAALFLANKSLEMRGVLNDLGELATHAEGGHLADPVRALLGESPHRVQRLEFDQFGGHVPAILSRAQQSILESARNHALTLAVGPPGTGKSFTIATLAIEAMSRGESVLIASKMDHAVDVVADKIEQSLGLKDVCVRAGRKNYLRQLKGFFEDLLSGLYHDSDITGKTLRKTERALREMEKRITKLEDATEHRNRRAERRGRLLSEPDPGWITRWRQKRIRKAVAEETAGFAIAERMEGLIDERIRVTVDYLRRLRSFYLNAALVRYRTTFQSFSKGIRARTTHKKEEYFDSVDWKGLLLALPVWLSKLSDLHRIIPMKAGMFDLVIIDESSQCDMASALPALARAKRAVITGDPKQLRHISFLPVARQHELARIHGLDEEDASSFDFRRVSLVDLVSERIRDQKQVIFLNEHFRSRPEIIAFSNREFYSDRLAIMTGHREVDRQGGAPLSLQEVGGVRKENGINEEEIEAVLEQVLSFASSGETRTLGILSPFRSQVEAFQKRVERSDLALTLLERNQLLIGTAHSFQGEERDIMFLSFAVDDHSPAASFRFLEREDVFNVSITRARIENRVFASFSPSEHGNGLVARFLDYAGGGASGKAPPGEHRERQEGLVPESTLSGDARCLARELEQRGCEVLPDFAIGGYEVDLLCNRGDISLGIDLIGFPGKGFEAVGRERHLALRRAGIRLVPVSLAEWRVRKEDVLAALGVGNLSAE